MRQRRTDHPVHLFLVIAFACVIPVSAYAATGRTAGSFDVSNTGTGSYSIPIFTPPGTAGMTPQLALVYSHQSSNSLLGMGWNISGLSVISRCARTWAQDGEARNVRNDLTDRFCLDGNKLRLVSGTYGVAGSTYQTEIETFSRVTASGAAGNGPASFTVERKDGLIYEYGATADSRIESLGQSTAREWAVSRIRDRAGNAIDFTYTEDTTNGSYRISTVQYTTNSSQGLSAAYSVTFVYETKPSNEIDSRYLAGSRIKEINRLDRIDVTYSGTQVRRYELAYEPALSAAGKSRLASITECAGPSIDCLSPTTFTYQDGTVGLGSEISSGTTIPAGGGVMAIDINGDGRTDYVYSSHVTSGSGTWMYKLANSSGTFDAAVNSGVGNTNYGQAIPIDYNADGRGDFMVPLSGGTWWVVQGTATGLSPAINTGIPATGAGGNARAMDVDGDGLDDLVFANLAGGSNDSVQVRYRVWGSTFSAPSFLVSPVGFNRAIVGPVFGGNSFASRTGYPDFNGDGRKDFIVRKSQLDPEEGTTSYEVITVLGGGGTCTTSDLNIASDMVYPDLNGDGNSDLVYAFNLQWRYRFASGACFGAETPFSTTGLVLGDLVAMDWDGDGHDDLVTRKLSPNTWHVLRSTGEALEAVVDTGLSAGGIPRVGDVNGDGLDDLIYWSGTTLAHRAHPGSVPDLLASATDGFGNSVSFTYAPLPSANYTKHADAVFPEQDFQGGFQVVNSLTASNGIGGTYTVTYHYAGARLHVQGRGFEGFYSRKAIDSRNNLQHLIQFNRQFPYTGTPAQVDLFQANGTTLISRSVNEWDAHSYGSGFASRVLPFLEHSTVTTREVGGAYNGNLLSTSVTTNVFDSTTGTLTDSTTTTTEEPTANGVQSGAQYVQRTWHSALFTDETNWCMGRPSTTQFIRSHNLAGGTQLTREIANTWNGPLCRVTQSQVEPGDPMYQVTEAIGYDGFGNVNSSTVTGTGMAARTTSTNWGSTGQFPVSSTNALSQSTSMGWNYSLGMQASQTDPNGITVSWIHDSFGRRTREDRPDGTATTWTYNNCTSLGCLGSNNKMIVVATQLNSGGGSITDQWTYTDRFDRTIATASKTLSGAYNRVNREYDALGRVFRESAPCWANSCTEYWTTFGYDVLNRVTQTSRPVSAADPTTQTTNTFYEGLTTRTVDALNKQSVHVATVFRQISQSRDHNNYYQDFGYDAFGSLVSVVDSLSTPLMSATYDYGIGAFQRTMNDADLGASTKTFNALGEVTAYTDAKSQSFSMTYDELSRPRTRTEPDLFTEWTWGNSAGNFNIGQLASVSATAAGATYTESSTFDNKGRLASRSIVIPLDGTYTYNFGYSSSTGLLDTFTYPVSTSSYRLKLQYAYQNGILKNIADFNAPATVYWNASTTNARGQITQEALGNGVITNRAFDDVTGWVSSIQSGVGGGAALQNQSYLFDRVGNVTQRQNNNVGLTENFYYDNVHRLDYSTLGGVTNLDMSYDATGNITARSDLAGGATWTYHATKKHAVTQAGSAAYTFTYDANGNVTSRGGYTVEWTSYDHPSTVNGASGESVQFAYNHNHERWRAILTGAAGIETTYFVGEHLEKIVTAGASDYRHHIKASGSKIAIYSRTSGGTNTLRYVLEDHQGSVSMLLASNGTAYVSQSFTAFGNRRSSCTWSGPPTSGQLEKINAVSRRGYTWHTALGSIGLIDMNGRIQDAISGRFLSPDPFILDPRVTQAWNRYSYVYNNPLSYTDPTGYAGANTTSQCDGKRTGACQQSFKADFSSVRSKYLGSSVSCYGACGPGYSNSPRTSSSSSAAEVKGWRDYPTEVAVNELEVTLSSKQSDPISFTPAPGGMVRDQRSAGGETRGTVIGPAPRVIGPDPYTWTLDANGTYTFTANPGYGFRSEAFEFQGDSSSAFTAPQLFLEYNYDDDASADLVSKLYIAPSGTITGTPPGTSRAQPRAPRAPPPPIQPNYTDRDMPAMPPARMPDIPDL